jgi:hypothetical protein
VRDQLEPLWAELRAVTVIFLILGVLGAWGVLSAAHTGVRTRIAQRRSRQALLGGAKKYRFTRVVAGAVVNPDATVWEFYREVVLVSQTEGMAGLEIVTHFGFADVVYSGMEVSPGDFTITRIHYPDPLVAKWLITFPRPLASEQPTSFVLRGCAALPAPGRSLFTWTTPYRVDRLTLRVVLENPPSTAVRFHVKNAQHEWLAELPLVPDHLTHEYRHEVARPLPNLTYQFDW